MLPRSRYFHALTMVAAFHLATVLAGNPLLALKGATNAPASSSENTNWQTQFILPKGFRIEMVASEKIVASPAAMAFDENGRLFVAEMRDYPDKRAASPHLGRIRLLEDTDGDGIFNASTIYAEDIPWPSAIACYGGSVFVAATPDILEFKDTQGNGLANVRKAIFTGFGSGPVPPDADSLLNSFTWGPDNRIYCGSSGLGGSVQSLSAAGTSVLDLGFHDFSFDPRTMTPLTEAGCAQSGMSFDNQGRKLVCAPGNPLQVAMYDPRYVQRNPFFAPPPQLGSMSDSETNMAALPSHIPIAVPGSFAAARGCVVYRSALFPADYAGNVFIPDTDGHVIRRAALRQRELGLVAELPPRGTNTVFLASKDSLFKPWQIIPGPDGALYVADIRSGGDSGRIYRIAPEDYKPSKPPALGKLRTPDLVALLASPDSWRRDTAARLIYQRQDSAAVPLLASMLANSRWATARLNALNALDGLGALNLNLLRNALSDPDEVVRARAIALSEKLARSGDIPDELWGQLNRLASDPSILVRYQWAFTLGEIKRADRLESLAAIVRQDAGNPWVEAAVMSSLSDRAGVPFTSLAADTRFRQSPAGTDFLMRLAGMIGTQGRTQSVAQVVDVLAQQNLDQELAFDIAAALARGLHAARSALASADPEGRLMPLYNQVLKAALNSQGPISMTVKAIHVIGASPEAFGSTGDVVPALLSQAQAEAVKSAAIAMFGRWPDISGATNIIFNLPQMTPALRHQATIALLSRVDRSIVTLSALDNGQLHLEDFTSPQQDFLRTSSYSSVRDRAIKAFGPAVSERPAVVAEFQPAMRLKGLPSRGRQIFQARCAACHSLQSQGRVFGSPSIAPTAQAREKILRAILEPNTAIPSRYQTTVIETINGDEFAGIVTDQNQTTVMLQQPGQGEIVLPRTSIQSVESRSWSLMPQGLEQGLTPQDMADLIALLLD